MLSDLAFGLAQQGQGVSVITSRQRYDAPESVLLARETVDGVTVHRVWSSRFGRANLVGRAVDYVTFYVAAAWCLWRLARAGDVVVAKTDPPLLSVVAAPVARLRRARLVNWLQDVFPEVAVAGGVWGRPGKVLFALLRRLRNWSLRAGDMNVVLGDRMAAHLHGQGVAPTRVQVISNWQDGRLVGPVAPEANPLRASWGFTNAFVVGYSGNLGRVHELATVLEAMEYLDSRSGGADGAPEVRWLFVGAGAQHAALREEVARRELSGVVFKPYQPRGQLAQSLSVPDVHLVTLRPEFEGLIVPSKFYGVAAAGRATLYVGDPDGEIARLLSEHDCGRTVRPGQGADLVRHVLTLARDRALCQAMGSRARALFEARFDKHIAAEAWMTLLRQLEAHSAPAEEQLAQPSPGE